MAIIVIDAGHGGSDSGTFGVLENVTYLEKDINLDIAKKLKHFLSTVNPAPQIIMTRITDTTISVCSRGTLAKTYNADLFISCHNNGSNGEACGIEALYPDGGIENYLGSKVLTEYIYNNEFSYLNEQGYNMIGRGVKNFRVGLGVFRCSAPIPACITETAFMDCPSDMAKLLQNKFREDAAYGMALGIVKYLNEVKGQNLSLPVRYPVDQPSNIPTGNFLIPTFIYSGIVVLAIYLLFKK